MPTMLTVALTMLLDMYRLYNTYDRPFYIVLIVQNELMAPRAPAKPRKKPESAVLLILDPYPDLLKRIDDFRFDNRFESRSEAIRWLLDFALKKKPRRQLSVAK